MNENPYRHAALQSILDEFAETKKAAQLAIEHIQQTCPHEKIIASGQTRICAQCGLEERHKYEWGSGTDLNGRPTKLRSEFVKTDHDICKYRNNL